MKPPQAGLSAVSTIPPAAFRRRLWAAVALANLAVMLLLGFSLAQSRAQYRERAAITTRNLALVLEKQLLGTIEKVDLALLSAADEAGEQLARGGFDGAELSRCLAKVQGRLPELDALRLADARGDVLYGRGVVSGRTVNASDRDFFRISRDRPAAGLVISKPVLGRISGKWTIAFARRVNRPDGAFAGIVYAVISLEQISTTMSRLDIGRHGSVSLRDDRLGLIVRYPDRQGTGERPGETPVSAAMRRTVALAPAAGSYRGTPHDGIERTFSYRKLSGYPLYVNVGFASSDYLAQWRSLAGYAAGLAALFLFATLLSAWLIHRNWRRGALAVEELIASQDQIRILLASTAEAIYGLDLEGCCTFANPSCVRLLGYDRAEELLGRQMHELCHHSHADGSPFHVSECKISNSFKDGTGVHLEDAVFWRRDGVHFPVECWSYPQLKNGEVVGAVVTFLDITQRKHAEEALRANEAKFRMLFESCADPCLLIDGDAFVDCNQAAVDLLQARDKAEVLSLRPWEISPPSQPDGRPSPETARELIALAKREGMLRFDWLHCRKDGSPFPVEVSLTLLPGNGLIYTVWRDITERRQAQAALEQSRQQLLDIIDFLPDATFVTDRQGRVMAWNRAIEEMTGVGKARMLGQGERACTVPFYGERRAHLIDLLDLDDRELEEKYRHVQRKGKTLNAEAFTPLLHGGKGAYVWATAAPLFNCQGERTGAIEAIRDITAHKEAEATIIEYRDHLEEVVAQRTRELLAAKEAAETANRAKSQLLANLSHELRTPLNAIIGFSELTLQSGPGAGTHDHLSKINCAGKSLLAMINDLLDFAGSEEGMLELERTPFGLDQVLAREIANAQRQAQEKGLDLLASLPGELPRQLLGDPARLGQLLRNLLDNAVKFTERGTVELGLDWERQGTDAVLLRFTVRDSGIGIEAGELPALFQSFSQGDGSSTRKFGGIGVGLTICRRLAALMDGELTVQSAPGQGSCFALQVRLASAPGAGSPLPAADGADSVPPTGAEPVGVAPERDAGCRAPFSWIDAGWARQWAAAEQGLYLQTAARFGTEQQRLLARLSESIRVGDRQAALEIADKLRGLAGTLGAGALREAAGGVAEALRGAQDPGPSLQALLAASGSFLVELAALDRESDPEPRGEGDVAAMLKQLELYTLECDGEAASYLQTALPALRAALPDAPWGEIKRLVDSYELEQASLLLRKLIEGL